MKACAREEIQKLMDSFQLEEALRLLEKVVSPDDEACYLRGNIYRKQGNWKEALQCYAQAVELNPESPAKEASEMVMQIMNFYDKERYNV